MKLRIATRKSKLALVQTFQVIDELKKNFNDLECELVEVVTQGDQIQDQSLAAIGGKGLFIKGLELELLANRADIAMHSLKDVPPSLEKEFCIPAVLERQSPHDVLVSQHYHSIADLPLGSIVGTSSVRRQAALLSVRSDLKIKMIRGNVDTRIKKLMVGEYDALILAEAGLKRLGLQNHIKEILSLQIFTPSVAQGVIAIECLSSRKDIIELLQHINHVPTFYRITAERAMNTALNASCTSPIGSFANIIEDKLHLHGVIWSEDGSYKIETHQSGSMTDAKKMGELAAKDLIAKGAKKYI